MRFLEEDEARLKAIHAILAVGKAQLDRGEFIDGEKFMAELIGKRA